MAVPVARPTDCERCGGSANRLAVTAAADAFRRRGLAKLVVVGGSQGVHESLKEMWPADLEIRIVDGTVRHRARDAKSHLAWADVVVVWGSSELNHSVSVLYTGPGRPDAAKVISVHRRGIEALAERIASHLDSGR